MTAASSLKNFFQKLEAKQAKLQENAHKELLYYYLNQIDVAIGKLKQYDELTTKKILECLDQTKNELLSFLSDEEVIMIEGSEKVYIDQLCVTLKALSKDLVEANKKRAAYKKQFGEQLEEQKNQTIVKVEWLLSSFEIESNQNMQKIDPAFLKQDPEDAYRYILEGVYRLKNLKQELMKIEMNIRKNFERFVTLYEDHLDASDMMQIVRFDSLINQALLDEEEAKIKTMLKDVFAKKGFLYTKKKKMDLLKSQLSLIQEARISQVKSDFMELMKQLYTVNDQFSENLQESFKGEFCSIEDLNKIVRTIDDLAQNLKKENQSYSIKELILYG